ncbi:RNA-binding protein, partial [Candidatus Bathyarchaeota archaeon]|nr:RNA-binding protein [Candidatus Bathyarchaeota archaeon]
MKHVPILLEKRQVVAPGDLIAEGDYIAGDNTYKEKEKIYASRVGILEYETKRVDVVALKSFYIPRMEDIVIGTITEVGFNGWMV